MQIERVPRRRLVALAAASAAVGAAVVCLPKPAHAVTAGFSALGGADPVWLIAAGAAFLAALLASAAAWHRGLAACGAQISRWPVIRRYAAGSFVNTLTPANLGDAVRVGLLARAIGSDGAAFTTIGVALAVSTIRVVIVAVLFVVTVAPGHSLVWIAAVAIACASLVAVAVRVANARRGPRRLAHLADVVRGLAAQPTAAIQMGAWLSLGTVAKIFAAACVGTAVGVDHPVAAALVIVPTLELVGLLPLTPGNIGLTSAAVALALRGQGVPLVQAVAAGIGLHAVETLVGLTFGGACAVSLAPWRRPSVRVLIGAAAAALLLGAVTTTVVGFRADLA